MVPDPDPRRKVKVYRACIQVSVLITCCWKFIFQTLQLQNAKAKLGDITSTVWLDGMLHRKGRETNQQLI